MNGMVEVDGWNKWMININNGWWMWEMLDSNDICYLLIDDIRGVFETSPIMDFGILWEWFWDGGLKFELSISL